MQVSHESALQPYILNEAGSGLAPTIDGAQLLAALVVENLGEVRGIDRLRTPSPSFNLQTSAFDCQITKIADEISVPPRPIEARDALIDRCLLFSAKFPARIKLMPWNTTPKAFHPGAVGCGSS